jgi:DNA-directed RNA polymerase subunit RPC12/RpoP
MMPCPACSGRMVYSTKRPTSSDLEDTVYACRSCGAELIRTSVRQAPKAGSLKSAEAA